MEEPKLSIELVPSTCWGSNVRDHVTPAEWDILRRKCYKLADYKCEICGGKGERWPVECHEVWHYDDQSKIQTLERLIALCPSCHSVKHIGHSISSGMGFDAIAHLCKVNGWTEWQGAMYMQEIQQIWHIRSCYTWRLVLPSEALYGMVVNPKR